MSRANELESSNEPLPTENDAPSTGVFRALPAPPEAQAPSDGPQEMALLLTLPYREARQQALAVFERLYVRALLDRCGGNISHSARTAGLNRVYLHRLIRRHALRGKP